MTQGDVLTICKDALMTALIISAPFLLVSLVIGIVISVFQAATQINEQTLTFVPKILAVGLLLIFLGSWLMSVMVDFTTRLFESIANYI